MVRLLAFLIFASALLLGMVQTANACSCAPRPTVLDEFERVDEVVILKITSVEKVVPTDPMYYHVDGVLTATAVIEKVFKGKLKVREEITFTQGSGANCVWTFNEESIGEQYLFYLTSPETLAKQNGYSRPPQPRLWSGFICGRSSALSAAVDDLLYLENMNKVRGKTRISGTVGFWGADLPVEGRRIKIIGPKKTYEMKTNGDGVFEIYDLPPGKYFVQPEKQPGWKIDPEWLRYSPSIVRDEEDEQRSSKRVATILEPKKHAVVNIIFTVDNFVRGRVLGPKGRPLNNVCVYLLAPGRNDWGPSGCTNPQGRFEITSVPPGEYVLVANQDDKPSDRKPFRRIFYPGVSERERAAVIVIGPGDVVENVDLVIPLLEEMITVSGVVLYSDGEPANNKQVEFKPSAEHNKVDGRVDMRTDSESGRFTIRILKGLTGELMAEDWLYPGVYKDCPKVDELLGKNRDLKVQSNVIKLTAEQDVYNVHLTLPFPLCEKVKQ